MSQPIHILVIDDFRADYLLVQRHFQQQAFDARPYWLAHPAELPHLLESVQFDVSLSDYKIAGVDFRDTLAELQRNACDLPVILLSGSLGEMQAIDLLRLGVADFILKDNLARLAPAIQRCMSEAATRRGKRIAEQSLGERHAQLQAVLDHMDTGVLTYSQDGQLQDCNRAALTMHGINSLDEGAHGLNRFSDDFELTSPEGAPLPLDEWPLVRVLQGETLREVELRVQRRDHSWRRYFVYGDTLVHDTYGAPTMALLNVRGVTEKKRREEALRASEAEVHRLEESFRATFEQATVGVAHVDSTGRWLRLNRKLCDIGACH